MISVKNIYFMMSYAYRQLQVNSFQDIEKENFDKLHDLMAAIIVCAVKKLVKQGLRKEYEEMEVCLSHPKGKINMSSSLRQLKLPKGELYCHYDEFTMHNLPNQIVRCTMHLLLQSDNLRDKNKRDLKYLLLFFKQVSPIAPTQIRWQDVQYHRYNASYFLILQLCRLVIEGFLPKQVEGRGTLKLMQVMDEQARHRLFEAFVHSYYKKEYPHLKVGKKQVRWNVEGYHDYLPKMETDIVIQNEERTLIIDTKYYMQSMQYHGLYGSVSVKSNHLYQIFSYVKNMDPESTGLVSGVLLYAKTQEKIIPDFLYQLGGNLIGVHTLDLRSDFQTIRNQLHELLQRFDLLA